MTEQVGGNDKSEGSQQTPPRKVKVDFAYFH